MWSSEGDPSATEPHDRERATPNQAEGARSSADAALDALLRQLAGDDLGAEEDDQPLEPGARLGHFEVLAPLGRGGMGAVYLANDLTLRRQVALKVLHAGSAADPERRLRLMREARAAAAVSHRNIATVHEVGELDGRVYLAMEHVEGETLRARLTRSPPSLGEAIEIAREILAGLSAAHAAGLIHRDLKPDNVMLAKDGTVRLLDFGLAKRTGRQQRAASHDELTSLVTRAGHVLGTPAYMSPEQAAGDHVDPRSDLFSFGVVLYELLVGRRPFSGTTQVKLMAALLGETPVAPLVARPEVGAALSGVVMRCLAKHAAERFPDAAAASRALESLDLPPPRRRTLALVSVLLASSLALGGLAWTRWQAHPPAPRTALGANGDTCTLGRDCISGSCVVDRCRAWSTTVNGVGADSLHEIAVTADGQVTITGWFRGTVDLGCGPFSSSPTPEVANFFVARFKREGTCVWSRRFSEGGMADGLVARPNGNVIVLAEFYREADFGGGPLVSRGAEDIVVLELDPRGNHVRSMSLGGSGKEAAGGTLDAEGNLIMAGLFSSPTFDVGGVRLTSSSPGYADVFVAKLSPSGEVLWARSFAGPSRRGSEHVFYLASDARGDVAVMGAFYETLDLDGFKLTSAGEADAFLTKLSGRDGTALWAQRFGTGADEPYEGAVAFDASGNLFLAGEHRGAELGGKVLPGTIYVAALTPAGEVLWARGFGGESPRDCARRLVIDQAGAPVIFGRFLSSELALGDRRFVNQGGSDLYLARFDPGSGALLGAQTFFATDAPARAVALDPRTNGVYVGGRFEGSIDLGAGRIKANDQDGYLGSLGPPP